MELKTMISIRGTADAILVLLILTKVTLGTNATQVYGVAQQYPTFEPNEPSLAYLRGLFEETGTGEEDVAGSEQEDPSAPNTAQAALVNELIDRLLDNGQAGFGGSRPAQERKRDDDTALGVNSHLPPMSPYGEPADYGAAQSGSNQIRGPVNDPEEFEARLGELTDVLNHKMSNSDERQRLLMDLMNDSWANQEAQPDVELSENLISRLERILDSRQGRGEPDEEAAEAAAARDNELSASDLITSASPADEAPTSEYIDHPLALFGHQMVQGGAGEGRQLLGPDGSFENMQVVKSDSAIPSYCDPPNPCPLGYSAADGCIENFINSASFSREYQAKQKCSCDNEHSLFNCASPVSADEPQSGAPAGPTSGSARPHEAGDQPGGPMGKLDTLARTIENRFGDLASVRKLISDQQARQQQASLLEAHNDNEDPNYLARSARKWSPELNYHKMQLD